MEKNWRRGGSILAITTFLLMSIFATVPVQACSTLDREDCCWSIVILSVKDADGNRVAGATLEIYDSTGNLVMEGTTYYGWYVTLLQCGIYTAKATADGLTQQVEFTVSRFFTILRITLPEEPSESDCVIVTVLHDGSPVEDADVIIVGTALTGTTGTDGKASWCSSGLDPYTDYTVDASKGSWSGSTDFTTNSAGGADVTVNI